MQSVSYHILQKVYCILPNETNYTGKKRNEKMNYYILICLMFSLSRVYLDNVSSCICKPIHLLSDH